MLTTFMFQTKFKHTKGFVKVKNLLFTFQNTNAQYAVAYFSCIKRTTTRTFPVFFA